MTHRAFRHQQAALERLRAFYFEPGPDAMVLRGPSGSGKTWLALNAAEDPPAALRVTVLHAPGQESWQGTPYAPIRRALASRSTRWRRGELLPIAEDALAAASKSTFGFSDIAKVLLRLPRRLKAASRVLDEQEHRLLAEIHEAVGDTQWVLIADNTQWWDRNSLAFLELVLLESLRSTLPVLERAKILFVVTDGTLPGAARTLLESLSLDEISVPPVDSTGVGEVLDAFGVQSDPRTATVIESLTGGHLHLLRDIALYLARAGESESIDWARLGKERPDVLRNSIVSRLRLAGVDAEAMSPTLAALAAIGTLILDQEAACLLDKSAQQTAQLLQDLLELRLLERDGPRVRFLHEVVQQAVYPRHPAERASLHRRFSECLRRLNPGDYATRSFHMRLAGDREAAALLHSLNVLARLRTGLATPTESYLECADVGALDAPCRSLVASTDDWLECRYKAAAARLVSFDSQAPDPLQGERVYLLADCWLKSLAKADRERTLDLLEEWTPRVSREFDIWFRLASSLMTAAVQCGATERAIALEREIAGAIDDRRLIDPRVDQYRFALYRRSSMLHDPEICVRRQREAVSYFSPAAGISRSPAEYVRSAGSAMGTLVCLGEYDEVVQLGQDLVTFIRGHVGYPLPSTQCAANNILLARYLAGDTSDVLGDFVELAQSTAREDDRVLVLANLGAIQAARGDLDAAQDTLGRADALLAETYEADGYHEYLVRSNQLCVRHCRYAVGTSLEEWDALKPLLRAAPKGVVGLMHRRHEVMREALAALHQPPPAALDAYPTHATRGPMGRLWPFYARAFLLTDLQNWSDG